MHQRASQPRKQHWRASRGASALALFCKVIFKGVGKGVRKGVRKRGRKGDRKGGCIYTHTTYIYIYIKRLSNI